MNRRGFLKVIAAAPAIPYVPALPAVTAGPDWMSGMVAHAFGEGQSKYEWNDTLKPYWDTVIRRADRSPGGCDGR